MIPGNIRTEHILKAIQEIEKVGVRGGRSSRKFLLGVEGKEYPPKYVISLANKYANGKELNPEEFTGGNESNEFLRRLGFTIRLAKGMDSTKKPGERHVKEYEPRGYSHNERCPKCKETVHAMLKQIYGRVDRGHKFEVGATPEAFRDTPYYETLREIFKVLQEHRGYKEFVKTPTLPNCDFFMPDLGLIVEFDESQHFTLVRKVALEHYPEKLEMEFDRKKWIHLCETIDAKDNDPPYRDEQRAWYDTLRDFLPALRGLKPTIRLYAGDYDWCSLNPENPSDREKFKQVQKETCAQFQINMTRSSNAIIGRIIIAEPWEGRPEEAKRLLEIIQKEWPKDRRVKFLITCGGFIQFEWPKHIGWKEIGDDNRDPKKEAVEIILVQNRF